MVEHDALTLHELSCLGHGRMEATVQPACDTDMRSVRRLVDKNTAYLFIRTFEAARPPPIHAGTMTRPPPLKNLSLASCQAENQLRT